MVHVEVELEATCCNFTAFRKFVNVDVTNSHDVGWHCELVGENLVFDVMLIVQIRARIVEILRPLLVKTQVMHYFVAPRHSL